MAPSSSRTGPIAACHASWRCRSGCEKASTRSSSSSSRRTAGTTSRSTGARSWPTADRSRIDPRSTATLAGVKIVVLTKPVPDPAAAAERLGPDGRLDRAASPSVINGNDEYTLEAALKLADSLGDVEVTLLSMAPPNGLDTMRKGLAMGAHRGVLVTDPGLAGSDYGGTIAALVAALGQLEYDLVLAGFDASDGVGGVIGAAVATKLGLPYLSSAAKIEPDPAAGTVRVRRISATGFDVLEAPMPALIVGTQLLGEPRYPSLKGIMAARQKEVATKSVADLGLDAAAVGAGAARTKVTGTEKPPARGATQVVRGTPEEGAKAIAD